MSDSKVNATILELLEDDDEFEEFESASWDKVAAETEAEGQLWQDEWDDEDTNDDFTNQLREQINSMSESDISKQQA